MSRWIDAFNNHPFQQIWEQITSLSESINVSEITPTDVLELARFKKVVKFINELLNSCDPELVHANTWANFQSQSQECFNQISAFNQNKNIAHLHSANNNLDNLLSYISPYVVNTKAAAQAAGRAFKVYSDTVTQEIDKLQTQVKDTVDDTKSNLDRSTTFYKDLKIIKEEIDNFNNHLFEDNEESDSFRTKTETLYDEVNSWHTKIDEYHGELLVDSDEEDSLKREIDNAKTDILESNTDINQKLKDTDSKLSDLKDFYTDIFGVKNEETKKIEGGLQQELIDRKENLDEFKDTQEKKYKTLVSEIESLIPGAVTAGLATAYSNAKEEFVWPARVHTVLFYSALVVLCITASTIDIESIEKLLLGIVHRLPLILPIMWLAIFSSKRRSEAERLKQEYAHKEAIAKSYQSFKIQIDKLADKDQELLKKLLGTAIEAIAFNASETLDKKHGDKIPAQEIIENITSAVVKGIKG